MPNGHVHYDASDVVHWRYTEQAYPPLVIDRFDYSRGVRMLQLRGVRGYAPQPDMATWTFWPPPRNPRRADIDRFAGECIEATRALLVSDPGDPLDASVRFANLAWLWFEPGWAVVVGYHLYVRERGGPLRLGNDTTPALDGVDEAHRDEIRKIFANMLVTIGVDGVMLPEKSPAAYVTDLRACDEVVCSSTPLHLTACWDEIASLPVFDVRATGLLVHAMREHGIACEADQVALRWQRPTT